MTIERVLAQLTVSEVDAAQTWYSRLFDRAPDANPMPGLLEWHFGDACGVQVWAEPERAGHSTVTIAETDLDGRLAQLTRNDIEHEGAQDATASRVAVITDPDGNRVVFAGA
jgi:predicted enzyme related to lactoylglutathione lyase